MALDENVLVEDVRARLFAPSASSRTVGAELEMIPVFGATRLPPRIINPVGPSLLAMVRRAAAAGGWRELPPDGSVPSWKLPDGGRVSFEPGGQIEISSAPHDSCSALIRSLEESAQVLATAAGKGMQLLFVGADPHNDILLNSLQLDSDRYKRMTRYLEARSEFGARMMRQTAALQISVEHGPRPLDRWRLLNALAPYLIAIFANSPRYARADTGHASYRAHFWRELDNSRTGIPFDAVDAASRYAQFALDAGAIRAENESGELHTFRSLLGDPSLTIDDWHFHLSTLFPEIRPREYFEIRSLDTIEPKNVAAPLVFITGLVYDDDAAAAAGQLLGDPEPGLLRTAGRDGLRDASISSKARELVRIAMKGASRFPAGYLTERDRAVAADWLFARVERRS